MKFLVDRCAGRRLADWLRQEGHDVTEVRGPDPGDLALLRQATEQKRVLITIDTDFGRLVYRDGEAHAGLVRLPDVPALVRITVMREILERHPADLRPGSVITVRGGRIRVSRSP